MEEKKKIISWTPWVVFGFILAVGILKYVFLAVSLSASDEEKIAELVKYTYASVALYAVENKKASPAEIAALLKDQEIEIKSLKARGEAKDLIVKAELTSAGKVPSDGKKFRYFRLKWYLNSGWNLRWETIAFFYHLKLW